jgi:hypothetical protein
MAFIYEKIDHFCKSYKSEKTIHLIVSEYLQQSSAWARLKTAQPIPAQLIAAQPIATHLIPAQPVVVYTDNISQSDISFEMRLFLKSYIIQIYELMNFHPK